MSFIFLFSSFIFTITLHLATNLLIISLIIVFLFSIYAKRESIKFTDNQEDLKLLGLSIYEEFFIIFFALLNPLITFIVLNLNWYKVTPNKVIQANKLILGMFLCTIMIYLLPLFLGIVYGVPLMRILLFLTGRNLE
ncbi:hypothetical protein [Tenacibaculum sp. 190524A02b]|uniref:hypothetical protein n=1 Tax=Tenacibaculum vairaonense TaxID=3137860 RepID=UPI0032B19E0F